METLLRPFSPAIPSITANRFATPSKAPLFSSPKTRFSLSTTTQHRVSTGKFGNFLDLIPDSQPQSLDVDLPWFHHPDRPSFDVVVIGAGPAGLRLAEQVSALGIKFAAVLVWLSVTQGGPKIYSIAVPPSDIGHHFGRLLESGIATDVNFEVCGEIFAAHKLVLATRSPVFRAQLCGPLRDRNTQCIQVEDMEAPVFKVLLHYIYWDTLLDIGELVSSSSKWASTLMAQHLLAVADRYALKRLRLLCEAKLCEGVTINTVATTIALVEQHHCLHLKSSCLKFTAMLENLKGGKD